MHIPSIFSCDVSKDILLNLSLAQPKGESIRDLFLFLLQNGKAEIKSPLWVKISNSIEMVTLLIQRVQAPGLICRWVPRHSQGLALVTAFKESGSVSLPWHWRCFRDHVVSSQVCVLARLRKQGRDFMSPARVSVPAGCFFTRFVRVFTGTCCVCGLL